MNRKIFTLLFFVLPLISYTQQSRQQLLFNDGWKFQKGDMPSAADPGYDDAEWRAVDLPHDWSIEGPFNSEWASATAYLPGGIGWYRKIFTVPAQWKNKKVFIYFDGVYKNSEVWINGHSLGKRPNGFIPFQYELTPFLKAGKNTIAVKADHTEFADSRWYTGSGIYRNVYLVALEPMHIDLWGVTFTTPSASPGGADVRVGVSLANSAGKDMPVTVKCVLTDKKGRQVASVQKSLHATASTPGPVDLSFHVAHPSLWSTDDPYLYTLRVSVMSGGRVVDEEMNKVGIRSFRFDANEGFFLNGQNMKLKGVCIHDDAGVLGVAVPREVWVRRLRTLKEGGCNSLRMSHNPHADYLYDLCDEMGLLVMDEAFDEWETGKNKWIKGWNKGQPGKDGYHEYFTEWANTDLRDMVLRDRNHPSIIMWSIGNEIDYPNDPYSNEILNSGNNPQIYGRGYLPDHPPAARMGELSKQLVQVVKQYDTTRPVTAALAGVVMSNTTSYPDNLDVVGYNYQEYRYPGDHEKYPARVIYGSENGMQLDAWKAVDSNRYIAGQYLWTGIDYLGEAGLWPGRSNEAGLLDLGGFTKPEYFFRQSIWTQKPMIYIGTANIPKTEDKGIWSHKHAEPQWSRKEGDSVRVNCFTNCDEAELFLNKKSLGKKSLASAKGSIPFWDIVYQPGELMVKGYRGGREVAHYSLSTTGKCASITAVPFRDPLIDERKGVKQIEVQIADEKGRRVYGADNEVTVTITGPASLLGMENGYSNDVGRYQANTRKARNGRLIVYVKPGHNYAPFEVKFTSPGLQERTIRFNEGIAAGQKSASGTTR